MNKIILKNNKHAILELKDNPEILSKIRTLLSFKQEGAEFSIAFKNGWNGITCLLGKNNKFPIGLTSKVYNFVQSLNIPIEIEDNRKLFQCDNPIDLTEKLKSLGIQPRDYQLACAELSTHHSNGIFRAATGSGKCNDIHSLNFTEFGLLSYKELCEIFDINQIKNQEACPLEVQVATPLNTNNRDTSSMIYRDGYGESLKITTKFNYELTATPDHRIKIFNNNEIEWKYFKDLVIGDKAVIAYDSQIFGKERKDNVLDAYELGCEFTEDDDVSPYVRQFNKQCLSMFIRGVFDNLSLIYNKHLHLKLNNLEALKKIQLILLNFGIISFLNNNNTLTISNDFIEKFIDEIGNNSEILHYVEVEEFEKISIDSEKKFAYLPIESIESCNTDNWDFVVPETHSFISQGFINHNTLISSLIIAKHNTNTIVYVPALDLLDQFYNTLASIFDEPIGRIGGGICDIKKINVATIQTIGRALDIKGKIFDDEELNEKEAFNIENKKQILECLKNTKLHIIDECHSATNATIKSIWSYIEPVKLFGCSGTPFRNVGSDLVVEGILGPQIINITAGELIKKGILAQPYIKFVNVPAMSVSARTYADVYREYIVENDMRNSIILNFTKKLMAKGFNPLILFRTIKHGDILFKLLTENGIRCALLSGKDSLERRNEIKEMYNAGELDAIIASSIFEVGVDLPKLNSYINASGQKSYVKVLQKMGRVIRSYPGKKSAIIIEFVDNCRFLNKHSKLRYEIYKLEDGVKISYPQSPYTKE